MERFLTLSEVRAVLNVSRATLWRWTVENGLKVVRVGNVTRIRETDLQAFLARHESNPLPDAEAQRGAGVIPPAAP